MSLSFPPLPSTVSIDPEIGRNACPWLDEYTQFSNIWSPRGYHGFHEAVGIWLLSTIAARRVIFDNGSEKSTQLYIAMTARTSTFAKTTTAEVGMSLLRSIGLDFLLLPGDSTPEATQRNMAPSLPKNYADLDEYDKQRANATLAMAGQRGWYYDELGGQISGMMRKNGYMNGLRSLLRKLDDGEPTMDKSTQGEGDVKIKHPYLALLGNTTPADLEGFAGRGSVLWRDGFWARFTFIAPSAGEKRASGRWPKGERVYPSSLTLPLQDWHNRLGMPATFVSDTDFTIGKLPQTKYGLDHDVYEAFYAYGDALGEIISENTPLDDLAGNYTRLPEKAIRMAALFASMSGSKSITISHWARAQEIAERWRQYLHNLYEAMVFAVVETKERGYEDAILAKLTERGPLTIRDLTQCIFGLDSSTTKKIIDTLIETGQVVSVEMGRKMLYANVNTDKEK